VTWIYVAIMLMLGLHLRHGFWSALQSLGAIKPKCSCCVYAAGLVFAVTMAVMVFSELTILAQVGTTIGFGLLFDTLVIRSFMTPSVAALMGRWFWWPQVVRQRPPAQPWPSPDMTERPAVDPVASPVH
jgi:hypothetical protein